MNLAKDFGDAKPRRNEISFTDRPGSSRKEYAFRRRILRRSARKGVPSLSATAFSIDRSPAWNSRDKSLSVAMGVDSSRLRTAS